MEHNDTRKHQVRLDSRNRLEIDGVDSIIAFDGDYVCLSSTMGRIEVDGKDMVVEDLSKKEGRIIIVGAINSIAYKDSQRRKGIFG